MVIRGFIKEHQILFLNRRTFTIPRRSFISSSLFFFFSFWFSLLQSLNSLYQYTLTIPSKIVFVSMYKYIYALSLSFRLFQSYIEMKDVATNCVYQISHDTSNLNVSNKLPLCFQFESKSRVYSLVSPTNTVVSRSPNYPTNFFFFFLLITIQTHQIHTCIYFFFLLYVLYVFE